MSLGGVRDPLDPDRDTYSRLEADAVAYAVSQGAVVVAAVGNSDQAPESPWKYASYPAALPHVLGVSALSDSGGIPSFSNRDRIYDDIAAPGLKILSILPAPADRPVSELLGPGLLELRARRVPGGTGDVIRRAAGDCRGRVLLSLSPTLRPEQVTKILESSSADLNATNGCVACEEGRDAYSGWGRLDVAAAIAALGKKLPSPTPTRPTTISARARTRWWARPGGFMRRSTSGTTRTTSTGSGSSATSPSTSGSRAPTPRST